MFVNSGVLICISTFQNIFGSNFEKKKKQRKWREIKLLLMVSYSQYI